MRQTRHHQLISNVTNIHGLVCSNSLRHEARQHTDHLLIDSRVTGWPDIGRHAATPRLFSSAYLFSGSVYVLVLLWQCVCTQTPRLSMSASFSFSLKTICCPRCGSHFLTDRMEIIVSLNELI
jgi:hypothetical protein